MSDWELVVAYDDQRQVNVCPPPESKITERLTIHDLAIFKLSTALLISPNQLIASIDGSMPFAAKVCKESRTPLSPGFARARW